MSASLIPRPAGADWLVGGGEMGARIRALNWSQTPLGQLDNWPQSLRSAVSILLPSKAQIVLFWGPELIAIYNDAYRPVFGGKHPRALGMPARECWREVWDVLEPLFASVMATGEAFWAQDHLFGLERHGYLEETYFDVSYDPVRDESGRVGGLFCIVAETTGRMLGERRLGALRDLGRIGLGASRAHDVWRNAADVLADYAKDIPFAAFYSWDGCAGLGHLEAAIGLVPGQPELLDARQARHAPPAWPVGHEDDMLLAAVPDGAVVPGTPWPEPPTRAAVLRIGAHGRAPFGYAVLGLSSRRALDADYGDFFKLVAATIASALSSARALEDERKRAQGLAELDRAKTAFFSNVSHEFRTPLTLLLAPLEELLAASADVLPAQPRGLLEVAWRNGQRLLKLVNTLLEFARIEAGRVQASYRPTDLALLTADLASNFRSACERAGIALAVDCPPLDESVYVDRDMWEQIVLNLLSNAFKFTFEGSISVRLRHEGGSVALDVSDTGTGIPPHELPRLFERFHRVQDARGRSHEGSGIGLALTQELVKLHGGTIQARSTLGRGTTFTVTIPKGCAHLPSGQVREDQPIHAPWRADAYVNEALGWLPEGAEDAREHVAHSGRARILVADDNADLRHYVRRLLAPDYEVQVAVDGAQALAAARERKPDLVITDVMMPNLDGFGLIRALRADAALRCVPVIALSARAGEEARLEGLGKGADEYLVKPFGARELLVRVAALLQSAQVNRQLDAARQQFQTLLDAAPLGVYLVDDAFRIAAVNPVARPLFGDIADPIGRDFAEVAHLLWPPADADELCAILRRTLATGEPHVVPERIERRLDEPSTEVCEWQAARIPLPGGRSGVVCYFRDITHWIAMRDALREADSRKDEFLATLSHELRNPLAPLRSAVQVLKLAGARRANVDAALEIMDRQLNHLVRLVDDLLEVSRITRGSVALRREPVRLDTALRSALEAAEPLVRAANHRLVVAMPDEPVVVDGDPVRLAQVFANLLNNAARYSDSEGTIRVQAAQRENEAVVTIDDTGDGFDSEQLQHLFKLFTRGTHSARRHATGLGIGLALVRRLVEMHGGKVAAESAGPGKGSRFTVRLPLGCGQPAEPPGPAAQLPAFPSPRILIVDDNRDAATSLGMLLTELGAEVALAHDGAEGLRAFERHRPCMVLLDIGMPGMNGYEVARELRASTQGGPVTLVALTGWGQHGDRMRVRAAGFDHHLVKPADVAVLRSLLASVQ